MIYFFVWYYSVVVPEPKVPDPRIFLWNPASAADATDVNPGGINNPLLNGWSTFFINGKPIFINDLRSLPSCPPDCIISDSCVFKNFVLADDLFAKELH